jgi:hypothetical protein
MGTSNPTQLLTGGKSRCQPPDSMNKIELGDYSRASRPLQTGVYLAVHYSVVTVWFLTTVVLHIKSVFHICHLSSICWNVCIFFLRLYDTIWYHIDTISLMERRKRNGRWWLNVAKRVKEFWKIIVSTLRHTNKFQINVTEGNGSDTRIFWKKQTNKTGPCFSLS